VVAVSFTCASSIAGTIKLDSLPSLLVKMGSC
jgi:hypothetical protein